ncbi:MAG: PIG-L deacetylase family protein, partial [Roseiflexus sp.]
MSMVLLEVIGHAAAALAFIVVIVLTVRRRQQLARTLSRNATIAYRAILGVSGMVALIHASHVLERLVFNDDVSAPDLLYVALHSPILVALSAVVLLLVSAKLVAERSPRPRRILAIGAHPDDLEIACGATLAKMRDAGHSIYAMILTCGEAGGDPVIRLREAHYGARFIDVNEVEVLNFSDTELADQVNDITRAIEARIRAYQPDIILTHSAHDQHQDHLAVHQATLRAARNHSAILCYESPSVTRDFQPTFF